MADHWVAPFLESLADTGIVTDACRVAGISTGHAYHCKRTDGDFRAAWEQAIEDSADTLEREARRRAVQGIEEPVVYQGQLTPVWLRDASGQIVEESYKLDKPIAVGGPGGVEITHGKRPVQALDPDGRPLWLTITKKSDALLALLLKGRRKNVFADRTELTGADGGPIEAADATARAARVAHLMALAAARKAEQDAGSEFA